MKWNHVKYISGVILLVFFGWRALGSLWATPHDAVSHFIKAPAIAQNLNSVLSPLKPLISFEGKTVMRDSRPIMEFAVYETLMRHREEHLVIWMGSEARLLLDGEFKVKAGYKLDREGTPIAINGSEVHIDLPKATVLSVELMEIDHTSVPGYWNWITEKQRNELLNQFLASARAQAAQKDYVKVAGEFGEAQIRKSIHSAEPTMQIQFRYH
jgi:hypothetical protein